MKTIKKNGRHHHPPLTHNSSITSKQRSYRGRHRIIKRRISTIFHRRYKNYSNPPLQSSQNSKKPGNDFRKLISSRYENNSNNNELKPNSIKYHFKSEIKNNNTEPNFKDYNLFSPLRNINENTNNINNRNKQNQFNFSFNTPNVHSNLNNSSQLSGFEDIFITHYPSFKDISDHLITESFILETPNYNSLPLNNNNNIFRFADEISFDFLSNENTNGNNNIENRNNEGNLNNNLINNNVNENDINNNFSNFFINVNVNTTEHNRNINTNNNVNHNINNSNNENNGNNHILRFSHELVGLRQRQRRLRSN